MLGPTPYSVKVTVLEVNIPAIDNITLLDNVTAANQHCTMHFSNSCFSYFRMTC